MADESTGAIDVFPPGATGNVAPERVISGFDTGLSSPYDVQVDAAGDVFVSNLGNSSITEYAPQASGDATPVCTIMGDNTGLLQPEHFSLLPDGTLVVVNSGDAAQDPGAITVYPPGSCGDVTPVETIAGDKTTFDGPVGAGSDAAGTIFVANPAGPAVDAFAPGSNGNVASTSSLTSSSLGALTDLQVGFDGRLYVLNNGGGSGVGVEDFNPGSTGSASPARDITGASTELGDPQSLAVAASGGVFVADADASTGSGGATVLGFPAGATGNAAPSTVITGSSTTLESPEGIFVTGPQPSSSATMSISMTTAPSISVGGTTSDSATLSGGTKPPTGSVIFKLFGPNDPACSGKPAFTSSSRQVSGDGTVSASASPAQAGTYSWVVAYSGDGNNAPITSACGQPSQTVQVGVTPTSVSTFLVFGGKTGTSFTVPAGHPLFDQAQLAGKNASSATGTVTYNVYSDAACTQLVNGGAPGQVTAGDPAESGGVTLNTPGTYYWQAVYSGDSQNGGASSTCGPDGGEVETVTPGGNATTVSTTLSGGTQSGTTVNVDTNTSVTDTATLGGEFAGEATGTVTYAVYSDQACTKVAVAGTAETIVNAGTLPPSPPVKLSTVGTYYWQASYSGDNNNSASTSICGPDGGEVENVAPGTTVTTALSGGGQSGTSITVGQGTDVTDSAALSGTSAGNAKGTVTYNSYSDSACTELWSSGSPLTITTPGELPTSDPVEFDTPGTYYWQAVYSGDATHGGSVSNCGDEVLTVNVVPMPTTLTTTLDGGGQSGSAITVPEGTTVTDQAALAGTNSSSATGNVTFNVYSDSTCTSLVSGGNSSASLEGTEAASDGVTLSTPGTYYWTASYPGDDANESSSSSCGAETVTVTSQVQPKALILADSVTVPGQSPAPFAESLEQYEAEQDGYTVTSVTGAQWDAMTAAQFAQYRVVVIGDNTCSGESEFDAAVQNETTWEPVVMTSGGNKVLIGTDPVFHYSPGGPQAQLLANGIAYAGNVAGATGAYIDLSCAYDSSPASTPVPLLDGLSTHGAGQFTVVGESTEDACATGVNIVAQTGPTSGLTDEDLSNWECSVHEAFQTFPSDYTPLALAPIDSGFPDSYCADDVETAALACGSPYIMVSGGGVTVKSEISLAPATQTLTQGGTASLTATVTSTSGGTTAPVSGASVTFNVDSGPNVGATFTGTTDSAGQVLFSYNDSATGIGTDQVSATYTITDSSISEKATASVTWQSGGAQPTTVSTSLSGNAATGASITVPAGTPVTDSATLTGTNATKATGSVTYNVYSDKACTMLAAAGSQEQITPGSLPASAAVTLTTVGTYYWTASYSGDTNNLKSASGCGSETVTVTAAPTTTTTQLSAGDTVGTSITVQAGTAVTDSAMLTGAVATGATGTVTYDVYSDSACTTRVSTGTAQQITTQGVLPSSAAVTLGTAGTYYWTASYSGDANNLKSVSSCGSETVTVTAAPTTVTTKLTAGTQTGTSLTVTAGTAVTDAATLSGANAAAATGTVTYNVYSDSACTALASAGTPQKITTPGLLPPSAPVTMTTAGTYYWTASYSGDGANAASVSPCGGDGGETATVTPTQTTLSTSLSGSGQTGIAITVQAGTAVTDSATLSSPVESGATGTVTYNVYADDQCTQVVNAGPPQKITPAGVLPPSAAVTLTTVGTYYWTASYSGDATNDPSASACGTERLTVTPASTTLATSLSGAGKSGTAITVSSGTAVTDSATLAGAVASGATGTVTYNVYSDSACTTLVSSGTAESFTGGKLPTSTAVTLTTGGTYYWTASYSGDANNLKSASSCGSETEIVSPTVPPTTLATSLSGGGKTGTAIMVTAGTAVTDSATLSGTNAAKATGTVTYNVYSDSACTKLVKGGTALAIITVGTLPKSAAVTLNVAGTYYWLVAYSGDKNNQASVTKCGAEVETVTVAMTALATSLSGGGHSGTAITVEAGSPVTDTATLSGAVASGATGTVTFNVYSDSACTKLAAAGGKVVVSGGKVPASLAVTLNTAGKYYWTAIYSGDASDLRAASTCGAEVLTVVPQPSIDTQFTVFSASSTTAKVSTTVAGDILVALVAARGPAAGGQTVTVSGGGLTWHLVGRENAGRGDAEIWTAKATGILKGVSVKAAAKTGGFTVTMTIMAMEHATGTGALATATATSGVPKVTVKTTHIDAWVIAMADDWTHSVTPKPAAGQYVVSRVIDSTDTFWVQSTFPPVPTAGASLPISDTTPATDPHDMIAFEVF